MAGENFKLPEGRVFVKFIKRPKGNVTDPKHVSFGGMMEGASKVLPAKQLRNGQYANVLNEIEKNGLEKLMGLQPGDLSIYNKVDNYWDKVQVKLTKEGYYLNQEDPEDYIKTKVLESYTNIIAPSLQDYEKSKKETYQFILIRPDEESIITSAEYDYKKQAYMKFGKLEDNEEAMIDYLKLVNVRVAPDSSKDWLKSLVGKKLDEDPRKFILTLNDPDYAVKVLLLKAVSAGILLVSGGAYQTKDGLSVANEGERPTQINAIKFLNSPEGQDIRLLIESELQNKNKK